MGWGPAVRGPAVAPDGTLWVRRTPSRTSLATFDLFSADGEYLGTLTDIPAPVAFLPDRSIVAIEEDESEIDRVVVYGIGGR